MCRMNGCFLNKDVFTGLSIFIFIFLNYYYIFWFLCFFGRKKCHCGKHNQCFCCVCMFMQQVCKCIKKKCKEWLYFRCEAQLCFLRDFCYVFQKEKRRSISVIQPCFRQEYI